VRIFEVGGRLVTTLWDGPLPEGSSLIRWEGTNGSREPVATGVYFVEVETAEASATLKIVLLK
jgi:hypothetical protein